LLLTAASDPGHNCTHADDDDAAMEDTTMTTNTPSTYNLTTRYGLDKTFITLRAAKQYMYDRGEALDWERYEDCNGVFWAGFGYGGSERHNNDPVAIIR
jgi:hypothetical protein